MNYFVQTLKTVWNDRVKTAGVFFIVASMFPLYLHFSKQTIKTPSDLGTVQGNLLRYSFVDGYRGRHYYYIFLDGDNNSYKIPADFLDCFDKSSFESSVHYGDFLKILFNKRLFVFSISDTKRSYLSTNASIAKYNHSDIQVGIIMLLIGCAILVGRYLFQGSKPIQQL